jgi:hypothetical protein
MKLKEQFEKVELNLSECPYNFIGIEASNKCEQIADEFAIGFAEWCAVRDYMHINKQLLEIYKRENEL